MECFKLQSCFLNHKWNDKVNVYNWNEMVNVWNIATLVASQSWPNKKRCYNSNEEVNVHCIKKLDQNIMLKLKQKNECLATLKSRSKQNA